MNRARPYLNRFVKIKEQQIEDSYHSINLREMKPVTSKQMTHNDTILINNSKRQMIKEVRDIEIERQNKVLLQKISSVMSKKGSYSVNKNKNIRTKVNKSLNQFYRKRQMEQIQIENKRFVQRLQHKKPTLNMEKLNKDWADNKSVIKRMANCQFNLTSIKSNSRVRSITAEKFYKSKYEKAKVTKFKNIDGCKMLIKIEFVDEVLKITGDAQNSKDLKVIEVPRDQGVILIEKECQGKMENLVDKLRYDAKEDTLYLVTDDIEEGELDFSEFNPEIDRMVVNKKDDKAKKDEKKSSTDSQRDTTLMTKKNETPKQQKIEEKQSEDLNKSAQKKVQHKQQEVINKQEVTQSVKPAEVVAQKETKPAEEHVVEKKENELKPQEDKYEQQKFEESANNIAESKKEAEVEAQPEIKQEEVKQVQVKEAVKEDQPVKTPEEAPVEQKKPEIVVAPEQAEDYKQQFDENEGQNKQEVPQEPKIEA